MAAAAGAQDSSLDVSPGFRSEASGLNDSEEEFGMGPDCKADGELERFTSSSAGTRRNSISATPVSNDRLKDWKGPPEYAKSPAEAKRIKETIKLSSALQVLFGHLNGASLDPVVGAMFLRRVEFGEIIIEQGADGDYFYIVDSGAYDIFVQRRADTVPEKVLVATEGMSFGELALMYNVPRAATVRCAEAGGLWCLEREVFQMVLVSAGSRQATEYATILRQIDLFSELNTYEVSKLGDCLTTELFDAGEEIVRQGEDGDAVYFLYEGLCRAFISGDQGEVEVRQYARQGEYFGEIALLTSERRRATVRAAGSCAVLCLKKEDVNISVGSIRERIMENAHKYPHYEAYLR